jgi:hypothetical protein
LISNDDPIVALEAKRVAARNKCTAALAAAEQIEWDIDKRLPLDFERPSTWDAVRLRNAERADAFKAAGYGRLKAREYRFHALANTIELKMAETIPTSDAGLGALAHAADQNDGIYDGRGMRMIVRICEALGRMREREFCTAYEATISEPEDARAGEANG